MRYAQISKDETTVVNIIELDGEFSEWDGLLVVPLGSDTHFAEPGAHVVDLETLVFERVEVDFASMKSETIAKIIAADERLTSIQSGSLQARAEAATTVSELKDIAQILSSFEKIAENT